VGRQPGAGAARVHSARHRQGPAAGKAGGPGEGGKPQLSAEAIALQQVLRGIHF
jgi:hypothetical protein